MYLFKRVKIWAKQTLILYSRDYLGYIKKSWNSFIFFYNSQFWAGVFWPIWRVIWRLETATNWSISIFQYGSPGMDKGPDSGNTAWNVYLSWGKTFVFPFIALYKGDLKMFGRNVSIAYTILAISIYAL